MQTTKSVYWQGVRDGAPFILMMIPFSMLFGVTATETGLNLTETMAMSVLIVAGAAQFTALQLLSENAPTVIVMITALTVNLRMAMYSAALTPHLGEASVAHRAVAAYLTVDQTYACSVTAYEANPGWTISMRLAYFFGVATPVLPIWFSFTFVGAYLGASIPDTWALDFAIPITFLAMVGPALRSLAHIAAALVAIIASLFLVFVPFSLGIVLAGFSGMIAGAQVELMMRRKGVWT